MKNYIIKHVLSDGTVAGYHADSCCTIVRDAAKAKKALETPKGAQKWLKTVRKNFEFMWSERASDIGGGPRYRKCPCWKGHSLEQIETVLEVIS